MPNPDDRPKTFFWGDRVPAREAFAGIIAVILVLTTCGIAVGQLLRGGQVTPPAFLVELTSAVVGFYFGRVSREAA
jgi:hypothetical protein